MRGEVKVSKPKDDIELKTNAYKQIFDGNGEFSADKSEANILASRTRGILSIILETNPKIGIAVTLEDIEKVLRLM